MQRIMHNRFVRFIGVGGLNTLLTYILYLLFILVFSYTISYTIAYIVGIFISYWLNLKFVFQTKSTKKKLVLFPLTYLVQYILGLAIIYFCVEMLTINQLLAPIVAIVVSMPITFILSRLILK